MIICVVYSSKGWCYYEPGSGLQRVSYTPHTGCIDDGLCMMLSEHLSTSYFCDSPPAFALESSPSSKTTNSTSTTGVPTPTTQWVFQETRTNCSNLNSGVSAIAWVVGQCRPDGNGGAAMIIVGDMDSVVLFNCLWSNCSM